MIALAGRRGAALGSHVVLVAYPMRDGTQVLIPVPRARRTCAREDGASKVAYKTKAAARARRGRGQRAYRCSNCGLYHVASVRSFNESGGRYAAPASPVRRHNTAA
jgi:hypothetical protein